MVCLSERNDDPHLRREDRQAVADGLIEGEVSGDGKEGNLAYGEGVSL